jgi:cell wall assembly regulator SMI1
MNTPIKTSIEHAKRWMIDHGAKVIVDNLAPGCDPGAVDALERDLGFALPSQLRELWSLHNGQHQELDGFLDSYDLFSIEQVPRERDRVLRLFVRWLLECKESDPRMWKAAALQPAEADERWVPFAGRDNDYLIIHAETGRVFHAGKDAPPLWLGAGSLLDWLESYVADMASGRASIEEGFGTCYVVRD